MSTLAPALYSKEINSDGLISKARNSATYHETVDALHRRLLAMPPRECPLTHRFTPGLYSREIFMPRKTAVISHVHKTRHQYAVMRGRVMVWTDGKFEDIVAPFVGVTEPGTRRVLYVVEDTVWITFHPTTETDMAKLEDELIIKLNVNPVDANQDTLEILTKLRRFALEDAK